MAVESKTENGKIVLEIDNGDKEKIDALMRKWRFSDHQSFMRFITSVLTDTKGTSIYMESDSGAVRVYPAAHLLEEVNEEKAV
jgi:hypothetical protein